jgi:hypothetical protein
VDRLAVAIIVCQFHVRAEREQLSEKREQEIMSKLADIADRIKTKKETHDRKADEWARRLDAIDRREPQAFAAGDAVIAERDADLSEMENTMRQLSNLPLAGSGHSDEQPRSSEVALRQVK